MQCNIASGGSKFKLAKCGPKLKREPLWQQAKAGINISGLPEPFRPGSASSATGSTVNVKKLSNGNLYSSQESLQSMTKPYRSNAGTPQFQNLSGAVVTSSGNSGNGRPGAPNGRKTDKLAPSSAVAPSAGGSVKSNIIYANMAEIRQNPVPPANEVRTNGGSLFITRHCFCALDLSTWLFLRHTKRI